MKNFIFFILNKKTVTMKTLNFIAILFLFASSIHAQEISEQVKNNNSFTFELFNYLDNNENLFLSPFSVSSALAMTYEGAKGKTRTEMSKVLHFPQENLKVNKDFSEIINKTQSSRSSKHYTFNIANSLWAQQDFNFLHSYFETIKKYYHAPIQMVDYKDAGNLEKVRLGINKWVESKTNNKIKDLIGTGDLDDETKLVLVNAVYFLSEWQKAFKKESTKKDIFYSFNEKVEKDFMRTSSRMKYLKSEKCQMLEVPYKNNKASMIIVMPNENQNFNEFKKSFNSETLSSSLKKASYENIRLILPKFKIEFKTDLSKTLSNVGMKRAFTGRADFSGMTCKKNLRIDKIIHQTFINIDEAGTEAAAATAVVMKRITSVGPSKKTEFKANRPFMFVIRENSTGSILFIGQLVK